MKQLKSIFVLILLLTTSCAQSDEWSGTYFYESDQGRNVAEDAIIVEYTLTINKNECSISIAGYQIDESIICTIKTKGYELTILFKSYTNGSTKNSYDVVVYNTNTPLFVLRRNKTLITEWDQIKPDNLSKKAGEYFIKE